MKSDVLQIGRVVEVSGSRVVGALEGSVENLYRTHKSRRYSVGQVGSVVNIVAGDRLVFGVITALRMAEVSTNLGKDTKLSNGTDEKWIEIELIGEGIRTGLEEGDFEFSRGVVTYPLPGQKIYITTVAELKRVYRKPLASCIEVGSLSQASSISVHLMADELLGKHFAVLGTTGSGKSCAVTVLLRSILDIAPNAHILLLDPHNEYNRAFTDQAKMIDPTALNLPHWLLNFEESAALFIGRTEHAATSQTNILKNAILAARQQFQTSAMETEKITVDTPVPYQLSELKLHIINNRPKAASSQTPYNKIIDKIDTLMEDTRFSFLMRPDCQIHDDLAETISQYLRIPVCSKPLSIIDLSGVPSEVVDVVVSVLCRMVFDFALWGPRPVKAPIVLVCEEAHRYAPRRDEAAFQPTKRALSRIAKEGRKYGVGLGLVSQRPSELAESILSQCNSLIALRMSNETDQKFVQRALPDSVQSLVSVLPSLRTQEGIVVGEATTVPVRLTFTKLDETIRPQSTDVPFAECWQNDTLGMEYVEQVISRWRLQKRTETDTLSQDS